MQQKRHSGIKLTEENQPQTIQKLDVASRSEKRLKPAAFLLPPAGEKSSPVVLWHFLDEFMPLVTSLHKTE